MTDDGQLLSNYARHGDVESLAQLVARHSAWLTAYLRGQLASLHDAEDTLQETWVRVIRFCGAYRGGSVKAYLARIARSAAVDGLRRRRPTMSLDVADEDGQSPGDELVDGAPTPGERFEARASAAEVRRAVRLLPKGPREVLLMRIEGELPFREIAEVMGVPLGTALTWMRAATMRLKKMLGGT